jgi:hypothetical protein
MTYFPCPNGFRTCTAICRARGCHRKCKTYQERTRLPKDMAAWCRYFSALRMEDGRGALSPGEEMR